MVEQVAVCSFIAHSTDVAMPSSLSVNGEDAIYLGDGDLHDSKYNYLEVTVDLSMHTHPNFTSTPGHCQYSMHVYPTKTFEKDYTTAMPETFAAVVLASFVLVALVFCVYDWFVKRRNTELVTSAARTDKLVSSLFPSAIKAELLKQQDQRMSSRNLMGGNLDQTIENRLAQVYPETTIIFADLV